MVLSSPPRRFGRGVRGFLRGAGSGATPVAVDSGARAVVRAAFVRGRGLAAGGTAGDGGALARGRAAIPPLLGRLKRNDGASSWISPTRRFTFSSIAADGSCCHCV